MSLIEEVVEQSRMKLVELFSPAVLRRGVNVRRGGAVAGAVAVRAGIEVESEPAHLCVEDSRERLGVGRLASRRAI